MPKQSHNPVCKNSQADTQDLKVAIKAKALELGFDAFAVAPAQTLDRDQDALQKFVDHKLYGTMDWMARRVEQRASPQALWADVRSVLVLGINYGPEANPLDKLLLTDQANVSVYAQDKDYHDLVKKRLKRLGRWLVEQKGCQIKVFVDTAPILERALAALSGLGWQGKHSNLVSRDFGSWLFLGEIFTDLDLPPDQPLDDYCGSCQACMDICPTQAIKAPYKLDARACISYLTIEHEGAIPQPFRAAMGNRIYGCDDCLAICPWNKFAKRHQEPRFETRAILQEPELARFLGFDDAQFRQHFAASPIKRIGIERFLRNVAIAAGNSGNLEMLSALNALQGHPQDWVGEAATWAIKRIEAEKGERETDLVTDLAVNQL